MRKWMALALVAAIQVSLAARAEDSKADKEFSDQHFAKKATACGLAEVNLGNLAARRASDPAVKKFAANMVKDHTLANKELLSLANANRLDVATTMGAEHKKLMDKLGKLTGSDCDKAYMDGQVKDHEEAVSLFEKESKNGKNEKLRDWAKKTLPTLRLHLKTAKEVQKGLGAKSSGKGDKR